MGAHCCYTNGRMEVAMTEREFFLPSSDEKYKLRCMEWIPDGEIKAVLQIAHGMTEHIGRYREFAVWLSEQGIAVYGHDHLGHGKTAKVQDDFGYFGTDGGMNCVVKDIRRLTLFGKKKYPGKKLFLLGHSMGSFLTRRYLSVYRDGPNGIILLGTGGQREGEVLLGYGMSALVCRIKGSHYRSRLLDELSLGNYNRRFRPVQTSHDWLTRDMEYAKKFEEDELCKFLFTAGAYRDFFDMILRVTRAERAGRIRTDMPLLILSGDKDPVGQNSRGVRRVYQRYDHAGCVDITLGFYEGARHEILNETNREEVYEDIRRWIEDHK